MTQKTKSLYGAYIERSINRPDVTTEIATVQSCLKSEHLPAFLPYYVDYGCIATLRTKTNQLIVGRRGTGKTHLLGSFNEFINQTPKMKCAYSFRFWKSQRGRLRKVTTIPRILLPSVLQKTYSKIFLVVFSSAFLAYVMTEYAIMILVTRRLRGSRTRLTNCSIE